MQIYGPFRIQPSQPDRITPRSSAPQSPPASRISGQIDQLDLSPEARALGQVQPTGEVSGASGEIRAEKVAAIRRAIADGAYETPEKLDAALNRFLDEYA